mmetsp:Transcript_96901/g.172482  ORF Transcript_96901/g.172482 Transcript_96901/m.172482 type:complete len:375 (+) Transcript_96901:127-1251(+)|eukprot:CAMPEP_0197631108 /NCGR_PEP_ID=MMETSP1338-20131121/8385_1 /TAXON_ID=43686 ORGANISM="Pelagodinium beii, Strain RCC1491" /NCGR_SAMPLE_ID=MMETSP1338 /ASSEMBLY_ACC=CAM_ASM_000754 /LENGTH=374 /DNA_ID=CAMNT_0043202497 /DNA_START=122 /DNA_END=1246 /DNA_ORIENTATION=-
MAWLTRAHEKMQRIHHKAFLPIALDVPLRAFGQVIFCNSPISGAGILAALLYADSWLAVLALLGSLSASLTAHLGQVSQLQSGLAGYNGVLVGCGFATFLKYKAWTWQPVLATGFASVASVLISLAMTVMSKTPIWTFPFNLVLMCTLMYTLPLDNSSVPEDGGVDLTITDLFMAVPTGVSQIFVVNNWISGVILTLSLTVYSPLLSAFCLLGSLLGAATAAATQANPSHIASGLCGYNPALTACAVCTFFQPTKEVLVLLILSSTFTQILALGLSRAAMMLKIPVGTLPFCIAATFTYMLLGQVRGCKTSQGNAENEAGPSPDKIDVTGTSNEHPAAHGTPMSLFVDTSVDTVELNVGIDNVAFNERTPYLSP